MHHFQQSSELEEQQIPCIPSPQNLHRFRGGSNLPAVDTLRKGRRRSAAGGENVHDGSPNKRIMHRDIERQRRQEMANLHASLRSLLPVEYIKGKRSMSDHMHEAVNYIEHLKKRINELQLQKEKTMKMPNSISGTSGNVSAKSCSCNCDLVVVASPYQDGVEILISSHQTGDAAFPLSIVIKKLLAEGLDVVSCLSTRANETTFYRILSQADDPSCIDIMGLKKEVEDMVNKNSAFQ